MLSFLRSLTPIGLLVLFHRLLSQSFEYHSRGLVPKKVEGEFRLIHHLSYPRGFSLNDGISFTSYATVEDAIGLIKSVGKIVF